MVKGIDLSHYDDVTSWALVKNAGVQFAFLKATEGLSVRDKEFTYFADSCRTYGILCGAYHFFRPECDPMEQAKFFLDVTAGEVMDLPPVLDWETFSGSNGVDILRVKTWLDYVEEQTGRVPIIYGGAYHLRDLNLPQPFSRYPLWLAEYGVSKPKIPAPWKMWDYWQYSESGEVSGIEGHVDLDYAIGPIT